MKPVLGIVLAGAASALPLSATPLAAPAPAAPVSDGLTLNPWTASQSLSDTWLSGALAASSTSAAPASLLLLRPQPVTDGLASTETPREIPQADVEVPKQISAIEINEWSMDDAPAMAVKSAAAGASKH